MRYKVHFKASVVRNERMPMSGRDSPDTARIPSWEEGETTLELPDEFKALTDDQIREHLTRLLGPDKQLTGFSWEAVA